jgi:hypothetical protein
MKKILLIVIFFCVFHLYSQSVRKINFDLCTSEVNDKLYVRLLLKNVSSESIAIVLDRGYFADNPNVFFRINMKDVDSDTLNVNLCSSLDVIKTKDGCIDCGKDNVGLTVGYSDRNLYNMKPYEVKFVNFVTTKRIFKEVNYLKIILFVPKDGDPFIYKTFDLKNSNNCD